MTVYRSRPWWRTRVAYLVMSVCGYLLVIVALCAMAGSMLP